MICADFQAFSPEFSEYFFDHLVGGFNHLEKYLSMGRMTSHI